LDKRPVEDLVAARGHAQQLDAAGRIELLQQAAHMLGLPQGEADSRVAMTMRWGGCGRSCWIHGSDHRMEVKSLGWQAARPPCSGLAAA
jgi:hypothetical protein